MAKDKESGVREPRRGEKPIGEQKTAPRERAAGGDKPSKDLREGKKIQVENVRKTKDE